MFRRIPYIEINQQTECGLGCVCMLLRFYGHYVTISELREHLDVGRDGSSFRQLIDLLEMYNLNGKAYNIMIDNLKCIPKPAIIFWDHRHFVVLEKVRNNTFYVADPSLGYIEYTYEEFQEHYSNSILLVSPMKEFKKRGKEKQHGNFMKTIFFKEKALYCKIAIASMFMYIVTLLIPMCIQYIIDTATLTKNQINVKNLVIILIVISGLYFAVMMFRSFKVLNLRITIDSKLNTEIFDHLLKLPFKYFELRGKGNIIYNINSTATIREIFTSQLITGLIDCGAALFIAGYMVKKSPSLFSIALILFLINIAILKISYPHLVQNNKCLLQEQSQTQSVQMETVYSIMGIKMTSIENSVFRNWKQKFDRYIEKYVHKEKYSAIINSCLNFLLFVSPIIILCFGVAFSKAGFMTVGEVVAFYSLSGNFYALAHSVFNTWTGLVNSKVILERISDIVMEKPEDINILGKAGELYGDIRLENVSFRYTRNSKDILKDISVHIPSGKKVSIVGRSGDGKTTLAKLLVGLYFPTQGSIYYDDTDIKDWNKKVLRNQMGIVPQDISLFNKTIYENIVVDLEREITIDEVKEACKTAEILEEIEEMPMGFDTIISEMGMNLSGGQRQRILLARALLNKPQILILDEATSSLDNINQKKISQNLSQLKCTQIIIAHRLSTIIDSDMIIVMEDGKIVEEGTHDELLARKGAYYRLYINSEKEEM